MQHFISCDWGTSTFRLRLVELDSLEVLVETTSLQGIAATYALWKNNPGTDRLQFYCDVLLQEIKLLEEQSGFSADGLTIVISGMASSTIGMIDLPYKEVPYQVNKNELELFPLPASEEYPYPMIIVSGVRSSNDVMRGEETILAGCAIDVTIGRQLFLFPGTHSKHVLIENFVVKDLRTYMTGELFELMSSKSILSKSVEPGKIPGFESFRKGVSEAADASLLNSMFHVRTNQVFNSLSPAENYHYLSGLLIGEELKNIAAKNYHRITLVSTGAMLALYAEALDVLNITSALDIQDADEALIKGQSIVFKYVHSK